MMTPAPRLIALVALTALAAAVSPLAGAVSVGGVVLAAVVDAAWSRGRRRGIRSGAIWGCRRSWRCR
jgi:hypothetical protein